MHGIPLFAPVLHFSFAGEDATQPANGALVGVKILSGHGATLPATQFWIQWMNYLHVRITLLETRTPKSSGGHEERQVTNCGIPAEAPLHASVADRGEQITNWRWVLLQRQVNSADSSVVNHLSFSRL